VLGEPPDRFALVSLPLVRWRGQAAAPPARERNGSSDQARSTGPAAQASPRQGLRHRGRPRLVVFRSNSGIEAQLVNDADGKTLAAASWLHLKKSF